MSIFFHRDLAVVRQRLIWFGFGIVGLSALLLSARFLIVTDDQGVIPDFHVYFQSSRWVVEPGTLYRDFPSEYPLFANLWFAVPRFMGRLFGADLHLYACLYVGLVALIYGGFLHHAGSRLEVERGRLEITGLLIALISPGVVQLILLRFDFLPALLVFYALFLLRRDNWQGGALLLGAAIAAKGYPLVYGPAVLVFIGYRFGLRAASRAAGFIAAPSVVMLLVTVGFAGVDGMLSPFLFHAGRTFDSDSVYWLFSALGEHETIHAAMTWSVRLGTAALACVGAGFARGSFRQLARILTWQTFGLLLLSPISSPQFVIWVLPVVYFVYDPRLVLMFCGFSLFSNLWMIREFGVSDSVNTALGLTHLGLRFWLLVQSGSLALRRAE